MPKLTLLGTGTSTGVPQIGCTCKVCTSSDLRDVRLRTSALLQTDDGKRVLIDCGPDFRQQMMHEPFSLFMLCCLRMNIMIMSVVWMTCVLSVSLVRLTCMLMNAVLCI